MPQALIFSCVNSGSGVASGEERQIVGNLSTAATVQDGQAAIPVGVAGIFTKLALNMNATGTSRSVTFQKNGSNGNQVVTFADGTSGWTEDGTAADSVAVGDKVNVTFSSAGSNPTIYECRSVFSASSGHSSIIANGSNFDYTTASTTRYAPLGSRAQAYAAAVTDVQHKIRAPGTLNRFFVYVTTNARTNTTSFAVVINGSAGNSTVSVGSGLTGLFEDTTHTDTLSDGDLICHSITTDTGAQKIEVDLRGATITSDDNKLDTFGGNTESSARAASATVHYFPIGGLAVATNTIETQNSVAHQFVGTLSNIRMYVSANTYSAAATLRSRKNAQNGNQSVTITASTTGWFEDVSNSDVFDEDDLIAMSLSGGTSGNATFTQWGATEETFVDDDHFHHIFFD